MKKLETENIAYGVYETIEDQQTGKLKYLCPYCHQLHNHGGFNMDNNYTFRVPHCYYGLDRGKDQYMLMNINKLLKIEDLKTIKKINMYNKRIEMRYSTDQQKIKATKKHLELNNEIDKLMKKFREEL